jgi:ubiquinone/menaquinone biosynthesis C-methylase UbiE
LEKEKISYEIESEVESFHWWFVIRRKLLQSLLTSISFSKEERTMDIGCGVGSNLVLLESQNLKVTGLDRSIYALSLARKKKTVTLINGDLNQLPIRSHSHGLIIAMDILEHLENDSKGIHELHRVLREAGYLILTVPAFNFLWGIQDVVTGHHRRYNRHEILKKLSNAGFETLRSSYFNFFLFFPILLGRWLIRLLGLRIASENKINSALLNSLLKSIFSIEPYVLKCISFPWGVSIFCVAQKR